MPRTILTFLAATALCASACVQAQPPTDTGDPVVTTPASPSAPTPTTPTTPTPPTASDPNALAYDPDMKLIFASDCVICHGGVRVDGNYRMTTYAQVMQDVRAGNASSRLVTITQQNGSMYRYFSGSSATRQTKATQIRTWVVTYNAQEKK